MSRLIVFLCIIIIPCSTCKKEGDNKTSVNFSDLYGSLCILKTNRVSIGPDVHFPGDSLTESYYTFTDEDTRYEVTISREGTIILINPGSIIGEKSNDGSESKRYNLVGGLFAGGRFIIWKDDQGFEAEYTIYGSGVPIIRSERGDLEIVH